MSNEDKASVRKALGPLTPVLRAMIKHDLHFRKMTIKFSITGTHRFLQVIVTDNPVRAIVKTVRR